MKIDMNKDILHTQVLSKWYSFCLIKLFSDISISPAFTSIDFVGPDVYIYVMKRNVWMIETTITIVLSERLPRLVARGTEDLF